MSRSLLKNIQFGAQKKRGKSGPALCTLNKQSKHQCQNQRNHHGDQAAGHTDVGIRLLVFAVANSEQGNDGAVVGKRAKTTRGDRGNTVQPFEIHPDLSGLGKVKRSHSFKRDRHTTGARAHRTRKNINGNSLGKEYGAGHIDHGTFEDRKAGHHFQNRNEASPRCAQRLQKGIGDL